MTTTLAHDRTSSHATTTTTSTTSSSSTPRLVIGCALLPKKIRRYLTEEFVTLAHSRGLELVIIDHSKPLDDQGPFHVILHKLVGKEGWNESLSNYMAHHAHETVVVDPPVSITELASRETMLRKLHEAEITLNRPETHDESGGGGEAGGMRPPPPSPPLHASHPPPTAIIRAPNQVTITAGSSTMQVLASIREHHLSFPLVAKPVASCGGDECHLVALVKSEAGLKELVEGDALRGEEREEEEGVTPTSLILQEYIEHGGVLFKIYIIGDNAVLSPRPSLQRLDLNDIVGDEGGGVSRKPRSFFDPPNARAKAFLNDMLRAKSSGELMNQGGGGVGGGRARTLGALGLNGLMPQEEEESERDAQASPPGMSSAGESSESLVDGVVEETHLHLHGNNNHTATTATTHHHHPTTASTLATHLLATRLASSEPHLASLAPSSTSPSSTAPLPPPPSMPSSSLSRSHIQGFRISNHHLSTPLNGKRTSIELVDLVASPPLWVVEGLGRALRERLGLDLFNVDLICPRHNRGSVATYYVVDINYFPGYDKLPNWEETLVSFLEGKAREVEMKRRGGVSG